jgi:acyl-CoA synthetase (AMP-forming)/AMP-acid ligase II
LILRNSPQYVIAYFATIRIGAIVVGNNPLYTQRELAHQLSDVVLVLDRLYPKLAAIRDECPPRKVIVTSVTDYSRGSARQRPPRKSWAGPATPNTDSPATECSPCRSGGG